MKTGLTCVVLALLVGCAGQVPPFTLRVPARVAHRTNVTDVVAERGFPSWVEMPEWANERDWTSGVEAFEDRPKVAISVRIISVPKGNTKERLGAFEVRGGGYSILGGYEADRVVEAARRRPDATMLTAPGLVMAEEQSCWVAVQDYLSQQIDQSEERTAVLQLATGCVIFAKAAEITEDRCAFKFSVQVDRVEDAARDPDRDPSGPPLSVVSWRAAGETTLHVGQWYQKVVEPENGDDTFLVLVHAGRITYPAAQEVPADKVAADRVVPFEHDGTLGGVLDEPISIKPAPA